MTRLPASSDRAAALPTFKDGFGTRVRVTDAGGDPVEHLQLVPELANQESSIRDRVGRLINFRHARYVRLRGVDRAKTGLKPLVIAYDALEGHRLSTVLESLGKMPLGFEVDVALQIVRDLLPAIGILHDSRKVTHGAIAPERLVYTSQQRLVIVDHGLGVALMRLNLPRKKLWEQFRVASPATNRAVFDEKMDVVQIGLVALAMLLGRPLTDEEYPAQVKRLIFSVKETSSRIGSRPIGPELRRWLERATGIDEAQTFGSIKEAQDAFESVVAVERYAPTAAAVKGFFLRYDEQIAKLQPAAESAGDTGASTGSSVDLDSALSAMQMQVTIAPRRRAVADPPPVAVEAVELKPPSKTKAKAEAKAQPAAKAPPAPDAEADAAPVDKPEPMKFGRRKSDRLDALQALQEEMSAASGDISAMDETVSSEAALHAAAKPVDDSERLAREAAERARLEAETREQAEREGRALAEQVARDAAEQVTREAAERAAAERQARAASEREAVERGARQEAERQAQEASLRATREATEREAAERAARDASVREGAEREARQRLEERLERDAVAGEERRAREQAERDVAEQAAQARRDEEARERDARSAAERDAEREAAGKAQREAAAREAAERQAREQAEHESRLNAERARKEATERAAAERAARDAAQRAERAERDAAERAERAQKEAAGREAAERQARELAEREARAAERALKEAAERAVAERAARDAADLAAREAAERAAAQRAAAEAAQRAEREAADRQAAERVAQEAKERAAREATERAAAERAAREASEREAAHKVARELAEQAVLEAAEREATHRIALQAAELAVREAAERADTERAARQVAEQAAREASQRAMADLVAQHADARGEFEAAGRVAAERAARQHAEVAEQERIARTEAQREAREAGERAQREAAERAAAERAAREHAARAESEREARAAAEREARAAAERAERHAAERHAAERAAREAAALMETERQARAAAEQAARDAAGREAAERAAREAAELAAENEPRRRRRKKRPAGRTPEEISAVQPMPSGPALADTQSGPMPAGAGPSAPAPATFTAAADVPAAPMVQWQPGQSVEVLPAWARGAGSDAPSASDAEPEAVSYTPPPSQLTTDVFTPPAAEPSASILAFKPQPDTWMHRAPQQAETAPDAESRAVPPGSTVAPRRAFRINWQRTLAASLLVALLEGVAFATAWWYVTPEQQGWLVVHTKPAGIQIAVDGLVLGKTPFAKALAPGRHTIELRYGTGTRVVPVEISAGVQTEQRLSWGNGFTSGQAAISSSTAGSKVTIDGRLMGKTPLTVSDLLPGKHEVTVEGENGSVSTMLMVEAGQTTELDVPVYAGWASVLSPVQLDILLDGKLVGSTEIEKLMLRPGKHNLELVNESLGYRGSVEVRVRPGATTSVSVVPKTPVTVDAPAGTELSINGENMGTLPNPALQVPLGTAEFVMRYKDEERRQVVPVTMSAPVTVKYELATVVERDASR